MNDDNDDRFKCPITHEYFTNPVVAADGFCYERTAIIEWFKHRNTSPKTNLQLEHICVCPSRGRNRVFTKKIKLYFILNFY
jgi:hypothetical protein